MEQEVKPVTELMTAVEQAVKSERERGSAHRLIVGSDSGARTVTDSDPTEYPHPVRPRARQLGPALLAQMMALSAHSDLPPDAFDHIWGRAPSLDDLDQQVLSHEEARLAFKPSASDIERQNKAEAKRARRASKLSAKGL